MNGFRNSLAAICAALLLSGALVLAPLPTSYGQQRSRPESPGQEQKQEEGTSAPAEGLTREEGAGAEHRAGPCEHQPPGHAYGRSKRCPPQGSSAGIARGDFNGDGIGDLAVGVPFEDVGNVIDAGAVNIIYGSATGLSASGNQFWTQDSPGVSDVAETGDRFGSTLAAGDFNGDGFSDLAIGVPKEDVVIRSITGETADDAGAVNVIYGSATGLTATGNQFFTQNSAGILDAAEKLDQFGNALAWGDFNQDSFGDLVVGVPHEVVGLVGGGAVNVIYGSAGGLTATGNQLWTQDSADAFGDILDETEVSDKFGATLTAGDFNGDGASDLAVGVITESRDFATEGGINVIYGMPGSGLTTYGNQFVDNSLGNDETNDQFGSVLAAGDFNGDGFADLAVGVPLREIETPNDLVSDGGVVYVLYGTSTGLLRTGAQLWSQDSPDVLDEAEDLDQFGLALAAGDFNGDGRKDLAVGVPFEDTGANNQLANVGAVNILYGSASGLTGTGGPLFTLASESGAQYGRALTAWNFGNGSQADLAVGVPLKDVGTVADAGAILVNYGSASGLTNTGSQLWTQDSPGILDAAESGDQFGRALY